MIEFKNITKGFQNKLVLDHVSGRFKHGAVNLIVGASGTGKSVLMKCLVGLVAPDEGEVQFDGIPLVEEGRKITAEIRRKIGMLFQGGALFDSMNVEENVIFPLDVLTKMPKDEKLERANLCLKRVGLENINKKRISEISGGMKKRVGIARALVNHPAYLFCDEPNSGLDPLTALRIDELIQEVTSEYDTTTIVVTHDINSMVNIGDHILFLHQGKIYWEGSSQDIFHSDIKEFNDFFFASKVSRLVKDSGVV